MSLPNGVSTRLCDTAILHPNSFDLFLFRPNLNLFWIDYKWLWHNGTINFLTKSQWWIDLFYTLCSVLYIILPSNSQNRKKLSDLTRLKITICHWNHIQRGVSRTLSNKKLFNNTRMINGCLWVPYINAVIVVQQTHYGSHFGVWFLNELKRAPRKIWLIFYSIPY